MFPSLDLISVTLVGTNDSINSKHTDVMPSAYPRYHYTAFIPMT